MKKILFAFLFIVLSTVLWAYGSQEATTAQQVQASQNEIQTQSINNIPVPQVNYFQERSTIARWTIFWDKPDMPAYVYVFMFGNPIGYWVSNGKPASIRSYLVPEEMFKRGDQGQSYGDFVVSAPNIDGTWGEDNPGLRFFTAEGVPIEVGGVGTTYVYSSVPLSIAAPLLNPKQ